MSVQIQPYFQIINNGTAAVPLSSLTIRYFYQKDGNTSAEQNFACDYAQVGGTGITGSVSAVFNTYTGTDADEYVEISFTASAGSLAPGANSGQIQARIHSTDYQYMLTQTNDYSYNAATAFSATTKVTLYLGGVLIYGTEPR